jgi:polyhydroxybutyrate depolymerase
MQQPNSDPEHAQHIRRFLGVSGLVLSFLIVLTVAAYSVRANLVPNVHIPSSLPHIPGLTRAAPVSNCKTPQHSPGDSNNSITSGGLKRTFLLHLPPSYGRDYQPLVINYHAYSFTAQKMAQYTNMAVEANKEGFIVVFPQGIDNPPSWNAGIGELGPTGDADDVQFTRDLLSYLTKNYCIDTHRVYVTGFSLGGGMAYRVACTLTNQIAAIATVAGAFYHAPGGCHPSRPLPVLEIHGAADTYAPYDGNPAMQMAAVSVYLNVWLNADGCSSASKVFFQQGDVTGNEWTQCANGTAVEHYRVSDGGHTWPGAGAVPVLGFTTHVIDANAVIWDFFKQYKS